MDIKRKIELFNLKGKKTLITGSSQGIGYALAKGLDAAGAEIILNGRNKDKDDLSKTTNQWEDGVESTTIFKEYFFSLL